MIFLEKQLRSLLNDELKDIELISNSIDKTKEIAYLIAKYSTNNLILALNGELGSGKTTFMQGFAKYFNIENQVSSPTFTIVNEYSNNIFHFDVYRLKNEEDFLNSIGDEYFNKGICIIEWAQVIQNILPKRTIFIDIKKDSTNNRLIHIWRK